MENKTTNVETISVIKVDLQEPELGSPPSYGLVTSLPTDGKQV
jgi:hypothetical protein